MAEVQLAAAPMLIKFFNYRLQAVTPNHCIIRGMATHPKILNFWEQTEGAKGREGNGEKYGRKREGEKREGNGKERG